MANLVIICQVNSLGSRENPATCPSTSNSEKPPKWSGFILLKGTEHSSNQTNSNPDYAQTEIFPPHVSLLWVGRITPLYRHQKVKPETLNTLRSFPNARETLLQTSTLCDTSIHSD
ncbi:hypothetical protein TNCV_3623011 [Trichonephila clavipes]|nr:hypothetical protein TNCV_3623011 [Trichonephila clavipes]